MSGKVKNADSSTYFYSPPTPSDPAINIKKPKIDFKAAYEKFKNFGEHTLYTILALLAYGFIAASTITFFHPFDNKNEAGDDTDLKKKMKIFERLDLLFPDDLEFSPYGFNTQRGLVDDKSKLADNDKIDQVKKISEAYDTDEVTNTYYWASLVKWLELGGPNGIDKPTQSEFPYTAVGLEIDGSNKTLADEKTATAQNTGPGFWGTFWIWSKEVMTGSLYFSYGRGRYYLKRFFKFLNFCMKKATPIANSEDDAPDYTYVRNLAAIGVALILVVLVILLLLWSVFSPFVGGVRNTFTKVDGVINNDIANRKFSSSTIWVVRLLVMMVVSVVIVGTAMFDYVWQPLVVFVKILLYPISYSMSELKKVFIEIVPTLMALFVIGMSIAAHHDLDQPVAMAVICFMLITYYLIFKGKINALFGLFLGVKTGTLGFHSNAKL